MLEKLLALFLRSLLVIDSTVLLRLECVLQLVVEVVLVVVPVERRLLHESPFDEQILLVVLLLLLVMLLVPEAVVEVLLTTANEWLFGLFFREGENDDIEASV